MRSRWLNYNHCIRLIPVTITTIGLFLSVGVHIYRVTSCELEDCEPECVKTDTNMMNITGSGDMNMTGSGGMNMTESGGTNVTRSNNVIKKYEAECDIASAFYIVFVLRVVTLVSAIKLFSPLKVSSSALQSLITTFRLKHLANVTVFYCAVLYVYALIGVHVIGSLEYHCVSDEVVNKSVDRTLRLCWDNEVNCTNMEDECKNICNETCVTPSDLSLPDLHCDPRHEQWYKCPVGTRCYPIKISRNLGYYGLYDNLGKSDMCYSNASA